jgi:hypothetical protein
MSRGDAARAVAGTGSVLQFSFDLHNLRTQLLSLVEVTYEEALEQ